MPVSKKRKAVKRQPRKTGNPGKTSQDGPRFLTLGPDGYKLEDLLDTLCMPTLGSKDVINIKITRKDMNKVFGIHGGVSEELLVELSSIIYGNEIVREPIAKALMNGTPGNPDVYLIDCNDDLTPFFISVPPETMDTAREWFTEWHINQIAPDPDDEEAREAAEIRVRGLGEKYVLPADR